MRLRMPQAGTLRRLFIWGGLSMAAFGFFCLSKWPEIIIVKYQLSRSGMLGSDKALALLLAGTFSVVFGWGAAGLALFWPELISRALAQKRSELLYSLSLFGTNIMLFMGLALGIRDLEAYQTILIIVFIGIALFFIERRFSRGIKLTYRVLFNRWLAFAGYFAAGTFFFLVRFPFDSFGRFMFSRDYPMFQYTALLDLEILKQGALYGWEPAFSLGYPSFLNLRSILIPYLPFAWLPAPLAFNMMVFATYISVPYLVYWVAREFSGDRDVAVMAGWAGVGVMTGYLWHILHWGMMPTFTSIPFFLLTLGFFARAMKGWRWGTLLAALSWAPVAYIHLGHFAHVALALFVLAAVYAYEEKPLKAAFVLAKVTALTVLFSAPYLILFARYRQHVILTNMFAYPEETPLAMVRALLTTASHFIPTLIWDWRGGFNSRAFPDYGYFALTTIFALALAYLVWSGDRACRRAGVLYLGVIAVAALSFVPRFQLSFQRMLYLVPPILALALGFWMGAARKRGHLLPLYIFAVLVTFYARYWWVDDYRLPTLAGRGDFDLPAIATLAELDGNYVLFENTASLVPYADTLREFEKVPEKWDVHAPGFVKLAAGGRYFSHPGYNPHPYYDMRSTYIATGTFNGVDLAEYPPEFFRDLFRKWGVEYLAVWSRASKHYFGRDAGYDTVLEGERYTVYRLRDADPRAVETDGGSGAVEYPDNFTALVTLQGVPSGSRVIVRASHVPEWRAEWDGKPVSLYEHDGQIAFDAPAPDAVVRMTWPKHRAHLLIPLATLIGGLFLSARRML